jgi:universal stress protein E
MKPYQHILVALDCGQTQSVELRRAIRVSQVHHASLHIVDVLRDLNMAARLLPQWQSEHDKVAAEKTAALAALAEQAKGEGVSATSQLLRGSYSEQLIEVVKQRGIDLLIRSAKGARSSESGAIGATSNQLLRQAPCDLWLTQGDSAASCKRVLAAIDATPDDEAHAALNRTILARCQELAMREACDMHIAYVWDIYDAELLRGRLPEDAFDEMIERNRLSHEEYYERALSPFGFHVTDRNVHLLRGAATHVIPEFCQQHSIDLLVCGTVARAGLSGIMIGNTANRMLSKIPCSILALRK